jgi:hypothetical protein
MNVPLTFAEITAAYTDLVGPAEDALRKAREEMVSSGGSAKSGLDFQGALQQWTMAGSLAHESMSSVARTMEDLISQR